LKLKVLIPNLITAGNLFFGVCAIVIALQPFYFIDYAFYCILLAALCDLLDGMVARLLNAKSEFGKQFDSLCDGVSFGVAPAVITISVIQTYRPMTVDQLSTWLPVIPAILFAVAAAARLAKFNIDTRQTKTFLGLPTPAAGLLLASGRLYCAALAGVSEAVVLINVLALSLAAIMLLPLPLLSLKLHDTASIILAILLVLTAIPLFILFSWAAISLVILVYILASPVIRFFVRIFSNTGENQPS